jgi:hypothetical protein
VIAIEGSYLRSFYSKASGYKLIAEAVSCGHITPECADTLRGIVGTSKLLPDEDPAVEALTELRRKMQQEQNEESNANVPDMRLMLPKDHSFRYLTLEPISMAADASAVAQFPTASEIETERLEKRAEEK